jgi:prepilin-type N-terminal cleavage/methylation domain-containing protein
MQGLNVATLAGRRLTAASGFTLLELALTLAILGVLAAGILVPFVAQVAQRKTADTERILEQAKEALMGYATATGRLPCPATAGSNGQESPSNAAATGACTSFYGYLPAVTLGFTPVDAQGYAIDSWGAGAMSRIRYAVSNYNGNVFTKTGGMRSVGPAGLDAPLIFVCGSGTGVNAATPTCGSAVMLTDRAPAVIWSLGANAATGGGTSVDEAQNAFPGALSGGAVDRLYVSRSMSGAAGNEFDDVITWLSVGNLVSRMVLGGQLP